MTKLDDTWSLLQKGEQPSRELIVGCLKELAEKAKALSVQEREVRGDYRDASTKFPQTRGEDIASDVSSILAQQEWIDTTTEPELEEVGSIAGSLEINTTDSELWAQLFEKIERLR